MKKVLAIALAVAFISSFAFADSSNWNLGLNAGYAMPSMEKVNNNITDIHNMFPTSNVTKVSGGLNANLDLMYQALSFLQIGPKIGIVKSSQGTLTGGGDYMHFDSMLLPAEIGASIDLRLKDMPFGIIIEGFGGYGFAIFDSNNKLAGITSSSNYTGGAPVFDFLGGLEINPLSLFAIKATIGYKVANIPTLKASADATNNNSIKKGDTLKALISGDDMPVDFSGFNFNAGVSFKF